MPLLVATDRISLDIVSSNPGRTQGECSRPFAFRFLSSPTLFLSLITTNIARCPTCSGHSGEYSVDRCWFDARVIPFSVSCAFIFGLGLEGLSSNGQVCGHNARRWRDLNTAAPSYAGTKPNRYRDISRTSNGPSAGLEVTISCGFVAPRYQEAS